MQEKKKEKKSVGIIMSKCGGYIIMVYQNESNMWSLPKGKIEENETHWECLKRELKEEISLNITEIPYRIMKSEELYNLDSRYYHIIINKEMKDIKLPMSRKLTKEIGECRWVPISEIQNYRMGVVTFRSLKRASLVTKNRGRKNKS